MLCARPCVDDPRRLDRLHRPVGPLQPHQHAVVALLHRSGRDAALHHTAELPKSLGEDLLRAPLGQAALELPGTPHPRERQLAHPSQIRVEHPGAAQMDRRGQHPSNDPRPGQISSVPGCNAVARAWRCGHRLTLHNPGRHPVARQLGRREQTRRPRPDHHHLGLSLGRGQRAHDPSLLLT
jgi:hypothetical protein